jgi:hypothetical protein
MNIELTPQQLASLKKFLERTELRGHEVPEFLGVVRLLSQPQQVPEEKG